MKSLILAQATSGSGSNQPRSTRGVQLRLRRRGRGLCPQREANSDGQSELCYAPPPPVRSEIERRRCTVTVTPSATSTTPRGASIMTRYWLIGDYLFVGALLRSIAMNQGILRGRDTHSAEVWGSGDQSVRDLRRDRAQIVRCFHRRSRAP